MLLKQYQYRLLADYFQFYVEDENPEDSTEHIWDDKKAVEIGLALGKGLIAIGTERNSTVPVSIEIHDSEPDDDFSIWDRVNECSIDIPSGIIVISGCTDYRPGAERIPVAPGCYRARVYYGGFDTITDFDKGNDTYKVALWVAPFSEMRILKERTQKA